MAIIITMPNKSTWCMVQGPSKSGYASRVENSQTSTGMKRKTRDCVLTAIDVLVPRAMWNSAKVLEVSWFLVTQAKRDDWNNWNFGTPGTCGSLKSFERSG